MDSTVKRLMEHRLDEARKKVALEALSADLSDRVSKMSGYKRDMTITPNYDDACVDIQFEESEDVFKVYPQKTKISNENSKKVVKVSSIDGAYVEGDNVYDSEGNVIGEALVRLKSIHSKSDYSESLDDAEFKINSKMTDIKKLENYLATRKVEDRR